MARLQPETFSALYSMEVRAGSGLGVAELRAELSATFPEGARVLKCTDEDYPGALLELADPPEVLCALGDLAIAERQLRVSIVGSRDASPERREAAHDVAADLAARGAVIVSGMAAGIDRAAHEGALSAWTPERRPGRTIAVLGTPLSFPWPPENAQLYSEITASGLALSECPQAEGRRFDPEERSRSLKRRNRLVAALGVGTLVMAARPGSSTLIEARAALALGRPVLIWHEAAGEEWARSLIAENLRDGQGRELVGVFDSARSAEQILSPWARVWWL
ncbi:DNA-processing protein DprA [Sutterella sp.]|uniref:DNA-processing protein DprA n=1 Tax=Sutterella sp. TaxID=1981025 RepID=UPI0026E0523A|nr:DNA-processing protein DprA [Sutterella sp.]MDO5530986.1 DNA-processing protein DprA [Sutterella sp.]